MTDRAGALERVAKLLPSLSRENDNEVVATIRIIGRTLESAGLDFYYLESLVADKVKALRMPTPKPEPIVPRPSAPGDPFRGASPFQPRPSRRASSEDFRAYAMGGAYSPGSSSYVSRAVSKALLDELDPRLEELGASDRAFVALVADKLSRGELLSRTNHQVLLDLVQRFRRTK